MKSFTKKHFFVLSAQKLFYFCHYFSLHIHEETTGPYLPHAKNE